MIVVCVFGNGNLRFFLKELVNYNEMLIMISNLSLSIRCFFRFFDNQEIMSVLGCESNVFYKYLIYNG